jgi:hypothetical protein
MGRAPADEPQHEGGRDGDDKPTRDGETPPEPERSTALAQAEPEPEQYVPL